MKEMMIEKYEAGYPGEDSMRSKAERMFREEMKGAHMDKQAPRSMSAPEHENMRYFKKGGRVSMEKRSKMHHHKMEKTQHDLVLPKRIKTPKLNIEKMSEVEHMKRGGKTEYESDKSQSRKELEHARKMVETVNKARGAAPGEQMMKRWEEEPRMKKGGKANKYAAGGGVYEREMLGEHPSHKRPHINYESEMKGERAISKPRATHPISKAGKDDETHGEYLKRGGKVKKMAMGGVGKMRHGEATKSGMPMRGRHKAGC